jgi:serine protease Do
MNYISDLFFKLSSVMAATLLLTLFLSACGAQGPRSHRAERDNEGWIGVYVQDIDRELQRYLDLDDRAGVLVNDVVSDGPAEKAGLRNEDVIVKFDGKRVRDSDDLIRAVQRTRPDEKIEVEITRDKQRKTLELTIGERRERHTDRDRIRDRRVNVFYARPWLGVRLSEINEDLAQYFSVDKNEGVVILKVEADSPAEKAALKAGDVILELAGKKVRYVDDISDILSNIEDGDEVEIKYKRRNETLSTKAMVERSPHSFHHRWNPDDLREWKDQWMRDRLQWQSDFKDRKSDFHFHDLDDRIRIQIDDEINRNIEREIHRSIRGHEDVWEQLGEELGTEMEKLGHELEREMENLAEELENMEVELRYRRIPL